MKTLHVRNVPDRTHEILRQRGARAGMSLQEYVLAALNEFVERPTLAEVLERAGQRSGGRVGLEAAADDLREERQAR
jgi:antitoxin FitA